MSDRQNATKRGGKRIAAAGTVVFRTKKGVQQVLLVHRPKYDDWSLPKGKVNPDEYLAACAVRETREETGVRVRLGAPVGRVRYPVSSGQKSVDYWHGHAVRNGRHKPTAEVDETSWIPVDRALSMLTYGDEVPVLERALAQPDTVAVLVVRHAKAMLRKYWTGRDQARPLDSRGRRQAEALVPLLRAYGVSRVVSSSSTRCVQTLKPYGKAAKIDVEAWTTFSEEQATQNLKAVPSLMKRLVSETLERGEPLAICGHRPVLPTMLDALGVPVRPLQPGAVLIAHLTPDGATASIEFHKPRV
ncbi:MAG: NUDIX hydrolase [Propionicimonas sp.]|uniref:NUDIX hydrolase n=1 Tax=Propionicimonas sp. TaxID=1955623 RepID=UPI002B20FB77|nr:NUDIX hydrolase [Propionicimonas sp.]MEA4944943.1 NUDIX hydrolase [Propionicimonas sp.]MEA5055621.1 NUDIX hydrolase [Propionicimonas sp.]